MSTTIKGCPWCGGQPVIDTVKHRNYGEPYIEVQLRCTHCAICMSAIASEAECDEADVISQDRYARGAKLPGYQNVVAHVVLKNRLIARWNTRS